MKLEKRDIEYSLINCRGDKLATYALQRLVPMEIRNKREKLCPACRGKVHLGADFCENCGQSVTWRRV